MGSSVPQRITIAVNETVSVSGLWQCPGESQACLIFAHGAGAGMDHPFMAAVADGLQALGFATLRYQFPYMESRSRRPDPPGLCHATVRAAVEAARELVPSLPLFAGGKSFGGRMTSQAQASRPLPHVHGIGFLGFPLHPPKEPSVARAQHLLKIKIPMLFLQGARDAFADPALLQPLVKQLGHVATLILFEDADHSFHVPVRSGRHDAQVHAEMLLALAHWMRSTMAGARMKKGVDIP